MSLAYKILGIPKTIEEFADKVKRKGAHKANVLLNTGITEAMNVREKQYRCLIRAESGKTSFNVNEYKLTKSNESELTDFEIEIGEIDDNIVYRDSNKQAVSTATQLMSLGLEATINGQSIIKFTDKIKEYEQKIEKLRGKYKEYL